jgi:hypothetical protein
VIADKKEKNYRCLVRKGVNKIITGGVSIKMGYNEKGAVHRLPSFYSIKFRSYGTS